MRDILAFYQPGSLFSGYFENLIIFLKHSAGRLLARSQCDATMLMPLAYVLSRSRCCAQDEIKNNICGLFDGIYSSQIMAPISIIKKRVWLVYGRTVTNMCEEILSRLTTLESVEPINYM